MIDNTPVAVIEEISTEVAALRELEKQLNILTETVATIIRLRDENMFRFLSKKSRNELTVRMVETAGSVDDAAKAAFRALKKHKRIRVPEELTDLLIKFNTVEQSDVEEMMTRTITSTEPEEPEEPAAA